MIIMISLKLGPDGLIIDPTIDDGVAVGAHDLALSFHLRMPWRMALEDLVQQLERLVEVRHELEVVQVARVRPFMLVEAVSHGPLGCGRC